MKTTRAKIAESVVLRNDLYFVMKKAPDEIIAHGVEGKLVRIISSEEIAPPFVRLAELEDARFDYISKRRKRLFVALYAEEVFALEDRYSLDGTRRPLVRFYLSSPWKLELMRYKTAKGFRFASTFFTTPEDLTAYRRAREESKQ